MNDDNFAEAARAEAEKRHQGDWDPFEQEPVDDWGFAEAERRAFVAGVEWARDRLAAQEPADAEVEAAARAIAAEQDRRIGLKAGAWWGAERRRNLARVDARAALSAAHAARRDEKGTP